MVNGHTVYYHPSPSELTSRIHLLIFLWTPKGFTFSPECFFNFFKPVFRTMEAKNFKFMVLRLLEKACVTKKVESVHFTYVSKQKSPLGFCHYLLQEEGRRKLTISAK